MTPANTPSTTPTCLVVMYHYVRDPERSPYPDIKGLTVTAFRRQVDALHAGYEMATLESAMAFWAGTYRPSRNLCLLTFDDGLKDHYVNVLPILSERRIQGLFFLIPSCIEERGIAAVHKNHLLMASLGVDAYRARFLHELRSIGSEPAVPDPALVRRTYRWDTDEVGAFKYLVNHQLDDAVRDRVLQVVFRETLGDEAPVADMTYLSWPEAREMQSVGMVAGGHSYRHRRLTSLSDDGQTEDLSACSQFLQRRLAQQPVWPFSYPYGKADTFNGHTVAVLRSAGFGCAFSTVPGETNRHDDLFALRRTDTVSVAAA